MTVRIGIIGTGGIAIEHLTNLLRLPMRRSSPSAT